MTANSTLIQVRDLAVHFAVGQGLLGRFTGSGAATVKAVDGVSLDLERGEVLGLAGESGSGKTTFGRALLGLEPVSGGSIEYAGQELVGMPERRLRPLRRRMQMVFQDPHASLNPSMDMLTAIGHPLRIHKESANDAEIRQRVGDAMERVGLAPIEQFLHKYPRDLSGGQKQRAALARSVILGPEFLVADEPVSMLDMSVRAKILELMLELKEDLGLTYLYITHDLATAKFFCDRIAIMYLGRIVEIGDAREIYANPRHPYTRALMAAIPEPDPLKSAPRDLPRGEIPDAAQPPQGCSFHPRCPVAIECCGWEPRDLRDLLERRWTQPGEQAFERERTIIADLDVLEQSGPAAVLKPGRGHTGRDVAELLERARADVPTDPFWSGVRSIDLQPETVIVHFEDGVKPGIRRAGEADVACVLYGGCF